MENYYYDIEVTHFLSIAFMTRNQFSLENRKTLTSIVESALEIIYPTKAEHSIKRYFGEKKKRYVVVKY